MIYGGATFMRLPLETIIKEFRKKIPDDGYDKLEIYADQFIEYLEKDVNYNHIDEYFSVLRLIRSNAIPLVNIICSEIVREFISSGKINRRQQNRLFQIKLKSEIEKLKDVKDLDILRNINIPKNVIFEVIKPEVEDAYFIGKISKESLDLFWKYCVLISKKEIMSRDVTGLVFCGFGNNELCPTLVAYEIDGIFGGRLKRICKKLVDIGRGPNEAFISGFAQKDMVESFVDGISVQLRRNFKHMLFEGITKSSNKVLEVLLPDDEALRGQISEKLNDPLREVVKGSMMELDRFTRENYTSPLLQMLRSMPKSELPNVAESLIELTSLKRKVSMEVETVGGEVDVAVITKSEGFVWIKRKHYFPSELNSAFFNRNL